MASLLIILALLLPLIHAFPSMLVESKSGCMIDLSEPEGEVIMNFPITLFEESSRPDLYVGFIEENGSYNKGPIQLDPTTKSFKVTLVNPGEELVDIQYALEILKGDASFEDGGCDENKRTHGRLRDLTPHTINVNSLEKEIQIVAAWAGGHEAVTLTDTLRLIPVSKSDKQQQQDDKQQREAIGKVNAEKHKPHDVEAKKVGPADVVMDAKDEKVQPNVNKTQDAADSINQEEDAHKDALDQEIQVLREEVQDLGKNHADIEDKMHVEIRKDETKKDEPPIKNDNNEQDSSHEERIRRFKKAHKERHADETRDLKEHANTVQRFKDAYKQKHKEQLDDKDNVKLNSPEHQDTIKRFKDAFREKHGLHDKRKILQPHEKVYERMKEEMRQNVGRRQAPLSFVQRVKQKYHSTDDEDNLFDMRSYMYAVVFFIIANLCALQLFILIGNRHEKGRRHE